MKFNDIVVELLNTINQNGLKINENSVFMDLIIKPIAYQLSNLYNLCDSIKSLNLFEVYGDNLDKIANFYGIKRKQATKSTVTVYIDLTSVLQYEDLVIPSGTIVKSEQTGMSNSFITVNDYVFSLSNRAKYEQLAQQLYQKFKQAQFDAILVGAMNVQSVLAGSNQNIKPYTLRYINTKFPAKVINIDQAVGGEDEEDDESLRNRLILFLNSIATSYGSESSLLYNILSIDGIKKSFILKSPHPLITRDGSIYDENLNLVKNGNYNCADIYVDGEYIINKSYEIKFLPRDINNLINFNNLIKLNFSIDSINQIINLSNNINYIINNFIKDLKGNIFYDGTFAFISDLYADKAKIVENIYTKERKLAYYIADDSDYVVIDKLNISKYGGIDTIGYILPLSDTINIEDEKHTNDNKLRYNNVIDVMDITEYIEVIINYKIDYIESHQNGYMVNINRDDIIDVYDVTNLSTNYKYNFTYKNSSLLLKTSIPPKKDDILEIKAKIKEKYIKNINYNVIYDEVNWFDKNNNSLYFDLQKENKINILPNYSRIEINVDNLNDNEYIHMKINGEIIDVKEYQVQKIKDKEYTFGIPYNNKILNVLSVQNVTKGFLYNLSKYYLSSNVKSSNVIFDNSLLQNQFKLDSSINNNIIDIGSNICFGISSLKYNYYTKSNFENNLYSFSKPKYDLLSFNFSDYHISLKDKKDSISPKILYGLINKDTTINGVVEIIDDLIIDNNTTLNIEPNTIIKVRQTNEKYKQSRKYNIIFIDLYDNINNIISKDYLFYSDSIEINKIHIGNGYYILLNNDILTIKFVNNTKKYYINNRLIEDNVIISIIESILDNNHPIIKSTMISYEYNDGYKIVKCLIKNNNKYIYFLNESTTIDENSINIYLNEDNSLYITDFKLIDNKIEIIDSDNIYHDSLYSLQFDIIKNKKINIIVNGILKILSNNIYESVLFTSASKYPKSGDWGGIVYTYRSNSDFNELGAQNVLEYARIEYADIGVSIYDSDVDINNCIFYNCYNSCIKIKSEVINFKQINESFVLLKSNFIEEKHVDYNTEDKLMVCRFKLNNNIFNKNNIIPKYLRRVTSDIYEIDLKDDYDFKCYINNNNVKAIDIVDNNGIIGSDSIIDYNLVYGVDYVIEYHTDDNYYLCFRFTESNKLTKVREILDILSNNNITCIVNLKYNSNIKSNLINNNIFYGSNVAIICDSSIVSITSCTVDCSVGVVISNSYGLIRGNIFTYTITPITFDTYCICQIHRNNFYNHLYNNYIFKMRGYLLKELNENDNILKLDSYLYNVNDLIKIDNELMKIKYIINNDIYVDRSINNIKEAHSLGSNVYIGQKIINVIYICPDCNDCSFIISDIYGNTINIYNMRKIYNNTYYTEIFDYGKTFYYKFIYTNKDGIKKYSDLKMYEKNDFNNSIIINFETLLHTKNNYDMENISIDPKFRNKDLYDYNINYDSYCNSRNNIYGVHYISNNYHKYLNFYNVTFEVLLPFNNNRIPFFTEPLIHNNYNDDIEIIGIDYNNANYKLNIISISQPDEYESQYGYIGAIIVDNLDQDKYGRYIVKYKTAINHGSTLDSYYITDTILYKISHDSAVSYDKITFDKNIGGEIGFGFDVTNNDDYTINEYVYTNKNEIRILDYINNNIGKNLFISIKFKGNDRSYNKYPILHNFTVSIDDFIDIDNIYTITSLIGNNNKTIISLNKPINNDTYNKFINKDKIDVYLINNNNNNKQLISKTNSILYGSTEITLLDNLINKKDDADYDDLIIANVIISKYNTEDIIITSKNNKQITKNKYYYIDSIENNIFNNKEQVYNYENKNINIKYINKPIDSYNVSYIIKSINYGDLLRIYYNENSILNTVRNIVEENKPMFADIIIKPIKIIDIEVELYVYYNKKINKEFISNNIFEIIKDYIENININTYIKVNNYDIKNKLIYDGVINIDINIYKYGEEYNGSSITIYQNEKPRLLLDNYKINFISVE